VQRVSNEFFANPLAFFAGEMKRLRAKLNMTQEQLAESAGYASSTVAAIESQHLLPSDDFAKNIDKALDADGHFERLQLLVEATSVLPWFRDLVQTERKAVSIQNYETYLVPGLLQAEDYARHAVGATRPRLSDEEIQRAVTLRMTRQEILNQESPPRLWAIFDESALRREVGGKEVMRKQCDHLLVKGQLPHITIQVMPDSKGAVCAHGKAFMILTFNNAGKRPRPPMAYIEDMRTARYVREQDEVGIYSTTFDYLRSNAIDDQASADLIRGYRDERYV
jgi:transcriptional regulator with XRE-family HTH domain